MAVDAKPGYLNCLTKVASSELALCAGCLKEMGKTPYFSRSYDVYILHLFFVENLWCILVEMTTVGTDRTFGFLGLSSQDPRQV